MLAMRCALCGRESEYSICGECLSKKVELVATPNAIELIQCPICGSYRLNKWKRVDVYEALSYHFFKSAFFYDEFEIDDIDFRLEGNMCKVAIRGSLRGHRIDVEEVFKVKIKRIACEKCSRRSGGYYESVIQIRAKNRLLEDEEIYAVSRAIEDVIEKEADNPKAFVTKIEERKEGIDIYLGDKKIGEKVSRSIARNFGAEIKESKSIAGREDGRDFYRFTYLIKFPEYFKGDIIEENGVIAIVSNAKRKKALSIKDGKTINLRKPKLVARRDEISESYVVNLDESTLEVIDPESYNIVTVEKPEMSFAIGDKVYVVKRGEKIFAIHKSLVQ